MASEKESGWKKHLINFILSVTIFFTGVLGLIVARFVKGNWGSAKWTYIPIFWVPIVSSWPISIAVLLGHLD